MKADITDLPYKVSQNLGNIIYRLEHVPMAALFHYLNLTVLHSLVNEIDGGLRTRLVFVSGDYKGGTSDCPIIWV